MCMLKPEKATFALVEISGSQEDLLDLVVTLSTKFFFERECVCLLLSHVHVQLRALHCRVKSAE